MLQQQAHRDRLMQLSLEQERMSVGEPNEFAESKRNEPTGPATAISHETPISHRRQNAATSPIREGGAKPRPSSNARQLAPTHVAKSTSQNTTKQENDFIFDMLLNPCELETNAFHVDGGERGLWDTCRIPTAVLINPLISLKAITVLTTRTTRD
jgi:hypothetical protein